MTDPEQIVDGRYRLLNRIGSGGMADVYCADDLQLGRKVALKLLHRRFAEDAEFVERFRREASAAAGLQHQHVVSVYDRGEFDGTYYIAMEFLDGQSLKRLVQERGPLEPETAVDLVIQVLRATRFAHKRGVIHRDLKPHNVIVDAEGRAKVTDFGIARAGASDMTQTGSIMGTAQYLSPEQAQGHAVSEPSDLYSIGIILYELLTGRVPFDGDSAVTIALKQVNETPAGPSQFNPAVTPELEAVVMRALEKDPARRFADAAEFIAALEAVKPGLAAATAPTAAAAGGGAWFTGDALDSTQIVPPPAAPHTGVYEEVVYRQEDELPPEDPRRWWIAVLGGLLVAALIVAGLLLFSKDKVEVPNVVGAPQAEAEIALKKRGLSTDIVFKTSDRPKDQVIGQNPAAGDKIEKGDVVTLTVSGGPGEARIPDLRGQPRLEARKQLTDLGFDIAEERAFDDEVTQNRVIETRPAAGESLERGQTVTLVISRGKERIAVPKVVGRDEDEAKSALEAAGFTVTVEREESTEADPGRVLSQSPEAGKRSVKGSSVTIKVAKEPAEAEVPGIVGRPENEAIEELSGAGFTVRTVEQPVDSPDQDGIVLKQAPSAGKAKKGSRVTITVGRFDPNLDPDPGTQTTTTP